MYRYSYEELKYDILILFELIERKKNTNLKLDELEYEINYKIHSIILSGYLFSNMENKTQILNNIDNIFYKIKNQEITDIDVAIQELIKAGLDICIEEEINR